MTEDTKLAAILAKEIKPGEEILWQGQAEAKMFLRKGCQLSAVIIILSIGFILIGFGNSGIFWSRKTLTLVAVIIIVMQGLVRAYLRVTTQRYILTNKRAMVFSVTSRSSITSTSKETLANYTQTINHDGSGSIIFASPRTGAGNFLWLKDVKTVSERLDQLRKA